MKQLLKIESGKVNKKGLKQITKAICNIMHEANNADRSDETTQVALQTLSESTSVTVANNVFTAGKF